MISANMGQNFIMDSLLGRNFWYLTNRTSYCFRQTDQYDITICAKIYIADSSVQE